MKKLVVLLFVLVLSIAVPALTFAQASKDFPQIFAAPCVGIAKNSPSTAAGDMTVKVKLAGQQIIAAGRFAVPACAESSTLAANAANGLCTAAVNAGWTCFDDGPGAACAGGAFGCCAFAPAVLETVSCTNGAGGPGFFMQKGAFTGALGTGINLSVTPINGAVLQSILDNTNAGNVVGTDPLPIWLFEVAPGVNGVMTFRVTHACGGANPRTFTVDTTGKTTLQIAEAVAGGFNSLGLACTTLPASVHATEEIVKFSPTPAEFNCQYFVAVQNATSVQQIDVVGQPGQFIVGAGSSGGVSMPALNAWGVGAFVGILLLTSIWFFRRRFREA